MSIDLTEVVQAAARAWYDAGRPEDTAPYDEVSASAQYLVAESLLPAITAAAPLIEAAVREQVAREIEVPMRQHDAAQVGFSAVGDAYAHAARIARGERP